MSHRIRISPDTVRGAAREIRDAARTTQEQVLRLTTTLNGVEPDWQGMASRRFYGEFRDWTANAGRLIDSLNSAASDLEIMANEFQRLDDSMTRK